MTKDLVIIALKRAIVTQKPSVGLIHHSDRGVQYASKEYQQLLEEHKIVTSMSRKGNCLDNACIEFFHSLIKKELIFHRSYSTRIEASNEIFEYIVTFYNSRRIHSKLNYVSPLEFERDYFEKNGINHEKNSRKEKIKILTRRPQRRIIKQASNQ